MVVGEDVVVVDVEAGQQRGARGAAHGRGGVAAPVHRARLAHVPLQLRHELQRPELHILVTERCRANVSYNNWRIYLVIRQDQKNVGTRIFTGT